MTDDEILLLARESGINFAYDSEGDWDGLTDDEISNRYTGKPHPEDEYSIKRTIEILKPFVKAIESRTLTNQKAKWYQEGLEAGLRQALDQLPDATEMIERDKRLRVKASAHSMELQKRLRQYEKGSPMHLNAESPNPTTNVVEPDKLRQAAETALWNLEAIATSDWRRWEDSATPERFEAWVKHKADYAAEALRQALAEQSVKQATKSLAQEVIGCFDAAEVEGLQFALAKTTDERLRDLVVCHLEYARYAAEEALRQELVEPDTVAQAAEREAIMDEWWMCVQSDLEHGVPSLNDLAAHVWKKEYPAIAGFAAKINARGK